MRHVILKFGRGAKEAGTSHRICVIRIELREGASSMLFRPEIVYDIEDRDSHYRVAFIEFSTKPDLI